MSQGWVANKSFQSNIRSTRVHLTSDREIIDSSKYERIHSEATSNALSLYPDPVKANKSTLPSFAELKRFTYVLDALQNSGAVKTKHGISFRLIDALLLGIITTAIGIGLIWIPSRKL